MLNQLILGLKKKFSKTVFHEKKMPFSVAPFILPIKHSNRAFEAFRWLQKSTIPDTFFVARNNTEKLQMLFLSALEAK